MNVLVMVRHLVILFFLPVCFACLCFACQPETRESSSETPDHSAWTRLLKHYVSEDGMVDYRGLLDERESLQDYLDQLSSHAPDTAKWSRDEQLAYWINAYNAFTVKLIIDNYPLKSIRDLHPTPYIPTVNTIWHSKFFKIGGVETSLDEIEHEILRKQFNEPRIHFAINCASVSCPPLKNEAFTAAKLDVQLNEMASRFINDPKRNDLTADHPRLSRIFSWFEGDFTRNGSLTDYINQFADTKIQSDAIIDFMPYDWSLNEADEI